MAYSDAEARGLIIKAGHELVRTGLIARTWGNISARISDTQFIVTPSGRSYETLTPDQLVVVNIADCSYSGSIKPSSEKRVHAQAYMLRPEVHFVIHTHQVNATIAGLSGLDIADYSNEYEAILGIPVACAKYGMSTTKTLSNKVASSISSHPKSKAFLMKHHGALCLGKDYDDAFAVAHTLESLCKDKIASLSGNENTASYNEVETLGDSVRAGSTFRLVLDNKETVYSLTDKSASLPFAASIHAAIYTSSAVNKIVQVKTPAVVQISSRGKTLYPLIDDLAQITGVNIHCVSQKQETARVIAKNLQGRNAVLIKGSGALCTGKDDDDIEAVTLILDKGCKCELYASQLPSHHYIPAIDALLQRVVYVKKYSKLKK